MWRTGSAGRTVALQGLLLAPMVAMMRMPLLYMEAQRSGIGGAETGRAVREKAAAAAEGVVAAQMAYFQAALQFWPEVLSGKTPSLLNGAAAERSMAAALSPAGKRVRANFRRLGRL
ncbi:MAG: hypothetical protein JNL61_08425 [Rhizobiaceae bacterium]|nr:hypothetical protein [Rhizobiaceae bacterium]